ncbi:hypothetical protein Leryth_016718 [Lithospermum erythrorhizon]|nr:hypothetical protein Leryth_016718 [Lithospermum erythrorhizon]
MITNKIPALNHPLDIFAIACGSSSSMTAEDGRTWLEDVSSRSSSFQTLTGVSMVTQALYKTAIVVDPTPYGKARISHREFTYTFHVRPGQKFIRLHFFPAAFKGFQKSQSIFSVKAGKFTLLTNFNPALVATASGEKIVVKEFSVNIKENQVLDIVFSPFAQAKSKDIYAFINGIEIVSMPAGLYFTSDSDLGAEVVGQKYKFYIDNATALEMVKRINIGGNFIPQVEDESMFRGWDSDFDSLSQSGSVSINRNVKIQYKGGESYIAPMRIYQSAKTTRPENRMTKHNLTWKISVDSGFRYLIRLHFCELEPETMKDGDRVFNIFINNEIAESNVDLIKWGGGQGVALYRDFVVILEGNHIRGEHNLVITLQPMFTPHDKLTGGILNGLEIFKMSNPDNHLTSRSVVHHIQSSTSSWFPKQILSFGRKNAIATMLTVIITSLNIIVYYLRRFSEKSSDVRSMSSQCHQFSLDEIRSTTNDFHQECLIGSGGYGKVYKGRVSSNGGTVVAIKRLKPESRQGENEFWTEIEGTIKTQHENLVPLIGYCNDSQEYLLIYQYMKRGTLDDHLYKIAAKGIFHPPLSWDNRLKISIGAASGLWYLHDKQVIHRDVKSSNILIDENWVAKISDFGLSKMGPADDSLLSHVSTDVKGTFGYLCPEYFQTRMLSFKSDVYAFGVVLLEVLTGRPAVDTRLSYDQHNSFHGARNCIRNGNVDEIIDPTLLRQIAPACLTKYVGIAQSCLKTVPRDRPSMFDVVRHLNSALVLQQIPDSDHITEVGKIYNEGSTSLDDTTSLIAETITSISEDDISTSSMEKGSDILRSVRPGLKEQIFSNVPSKKWWNIFRYFQKSPKPQYGGSETVCKGQTSDGKRVVVLWSQTEEQVRDLWFCIDAARVHGCLLAVQMQFLNLTSKNILLDESLNTKIDLYSAASKISTNNRAVLDSDYIRDEKSREKSAVFSFGILLYEVVCAGEASRHWFEMNPATVAQWITQRNYTRHIDPYLIDKISPESNKIYLEIASRCLHHLGRERPSISEIVSMLDKALHLEEATENN